MARTSLGAAKAELKGLLTIPALPTDATSVYGYEPLTGAKPVSVTVATAGMTPTDYLLVVRIYATTDADPEWAQETMDTLIMEIDARMGARFGPSNWTVEHDRELLAFVATSVFAVGREDEAAFG